MSDKLEAELLKRSNVNTKQSMDDYADHLRKARRRPYVMGGHRPTEELPKISRPAEFLPDPLVIGDQFSSVLARELLNLDPHTKSNVSHIMMGPTRGTMDRVSMDNLPIDSFMNTNLMGLYDKRNKQIAVNPRLEGADLIRTLIHEIAHAAGWHEVGAADAEFEFFKKPPDVR